jgi:serine protease Do
VADVLPGGPAAAAGLRPGDVLLALEGRALQGAADLPRGLRQARAGQAVTLRVRRRDGSERTARITLAEARDESTTSLVTARVPELGCEVRSVTPDFGVVIVSVDTQPGLAALRKGDVVRELNRAPVQTVADLRRLADRLRDGDAVAVLVQRGRTAVHVTFRAHRR